MFVCFFFQAGEWLDHSGCRFRLNQIYWLSHLFQVPQTCLAVTAQLPKPSPSFHSLSICCLFCSSPNAASVSLYCSRFHNKNHSNLQLFSSKILITKLFSSELLLVSSPAMFPYEPWILITVFWRHIIISVPIRSLFSFGHSIVPFSFCLSAPSRDAKPSVQLPDRSGRAANTQPRSHWQPAKQYGQPDARHDGPVPSNAVLSGTFDKGTLLRVSDRLISPV